MSRRQRRKREKVRRHEARDRPDRLGRQIATGAGVTVGATLLIGGAAQAATLTVGTTADTSGSTDCTVGTNTTCSLRDAIDAANGDPGSTITFRSGLSGTIMLESALPTITVPTTISGPGASQIAVSGQDAYRVFYISSSPGDDVSISGLTISDGASGTSTGAGVYSIDADFTLEDALVTGNGAADADGGGVAVYRGSLTIESSTISDNIAGGEGGGVYTHSDSGAATTIRNSTISGNTAHAVYGGGGAYLNFDSPALIENSTIYGNHADNSGGGLFHFGAYDGDPGLTVIASTITHNSAGYSGGGIAGGGDTFNAHDISRPVVRNTIVSGNTASVGPDVAASYSTDPGTPIPGTLDAAFSLIGSVDADTTIDETIPGSDILGQEPQLGPLAGNGGPTQTQLPANTSPVVNKGSAFALATDQRGLTRPVAFPGVANSTAAGADGSDMGAVELQPPPVVTPVTPVSPQPQPQPQPQKKKKCKKKKHKRSAESAKKKCKKKKKH
jgi:Right handed beta helix region